MGDLNQQDGLAANSLHETTTHRQLLSSLDRTADSASDRDTDDEFDLNKDSRDGEEASELLGVAISRAQTHMKSPRTPAVEKARAIEESRDYFQITTPPDGSDDVSPILNAKQITQSPTRSIESISPFSQPPRSAKEQRSSFTRAVLSNVQINETNRKRSSSGPAAVPENLPKVFIDPPADPGYGSSSQENKTVDSNHTENEVNASSVANKSRHAQYVTYSLPVQPEKQISDPSPSSEEGKSRRKSSRRMASDNSLYLKRATTGASEFDNTNAFSEVAEMANSRFRAITDSLAESSIKLPRIPSIKLGAARSLTNKASRTDSEATRGNIVLDRGLSQSLGSTYSGDSHPPNVPYYTPPSDKRHPILTEALSQLAGDIVFLGGYRGSILRSAEPPHHQLWVPVKVGLNLRKVDLEVGLTHEDEERMEEKIIPSGMLSHIGPIDIGRRLLKRVMRCSKASANQLRVHDWGYDWRLSPHLLSKRLVQFLESLPCNQSDTMPQRRGALVVAHSLGGLITRHAVNQRPELFSGVVYAGAPQNCCNILGPLRLGDDVLLSSRVLTAQVNFTLRTSYALLPTDGRCFLNKDTGERYDIDFFNVNTWEEYRLSPCIRSPLPPLIQTKKGLVDSITEGIHSLSPTRKFRFSSHPNTPPPESSTTDTVKDKVQNAKEDVESTARTARDRLASTKDDVQNSFEPMTMKGNSGVHLRSSVATTVTIPKAQAWEYLARTLAEVKQFKTELNHNPTYQDENRYPPHAIIYGKSVPTVYGAKVANREAIKCSDAFDDLAFAAGDGVVLASAAQLPPGYRCVRGGRVESDRGHIGLLGDLEGIGKCIAAVVEGRKRGVGQGKLPSGQT